MTTYKIPGRLRVYALAAGSRPPRQAYARRLRKLQKPLKSSRGATYGRLMRAQVRQNSSAGRYATRGPPYVEPFDQSNPAIGVSSRARMSKQKMFIETWKVIAASLTKIVLETATWSPPGRIVGGGM